MSLFFELIESSEDEVHSGTGWEDVEEEEGVEKQRNTVLEEEGVGREEEKSSSARRRSRRTNLDDAPDFFPSFLHQ